MSKGGRETKQTTTTKLDPQSQGYVNHMRGVAAGASNVARNVGGPGGLFTGPLKQTPGEMASKFFNPYLSNVVDATRGQYDHLRAKASTGADQAATAGGAFGGTRHAVMEAARLGELDRAEGNTVANLLHTGYEDAMNQGFRFAEHQRQLQQQKNMEPIWRQQQALRMLNMGMGPTGQISETTAQQPGGSWLGRAAGGAMTALGAGLTGGTSLALGAGLGFLGG